MEMFNPITIQDKLIDFSEEAEHVVVIRSDNGMEISPILLEEYLTIARLLVPPCLRE